MTEKLTRALVVVERQTTEGGIVTLRSDFYHRLTELPALSALSRGSGQYQLAVWNAGQISSVEGAELSKLGKLQIRFPRGSDEVYVHQKIVIHLVEQ